MPRIRLSATASVIHTDGGILLRSDLGTFQIGGPDAHIFVSALVPLLDGSRDKEAIIASLAQFSRQSIVALLDLLDKHGLVETLEEPQEEPWQAQTAFFRKWTNNPEELTRRLRSARVLIVGLEPWGAVAASEIVASGIGALHLLDDGHVRQNDLVLTRAWSNRQLGRPRGEALVEALAEVAPECRVTAGVLSRGGDSQIALEDTNWDLIICSLGGDELLLLRSLAQFAHVNSVPSLFGYIDGLDAIVGPFVIPGQTACWNCSRLRQLANVDHPETLHGLHASLLLKRPRPRLRTYLAPMAALAGHLLALEGLKIVSQYTPSLLAGRLLVQNLVTFETTVHTVIRLPWCDICGGATVGGVPPGGSALCLHDKAAGGELGRGPLEDVTDPGELRQLLAGWVDSRTGIIRHLVLGTPEAIEPELPVTCSAVLGSYTEGTYSPCEPAIGSGKGFTPMEAMIGAAGEALERYSAARCRKADLHRSALNGLEGDVLDPRSLCLYDDAQYAQPSFPFARFDPDGTIEWVKGVWLDTRTPVWMPALLTYYCTPARPEERFCQVTSSGLAAGATLGDAALRALLELVERDAFMITWLAQRPGRKLVLDDSLDSGPHEVVRQLQERGVGVELFFLDVGLGVPTVLCLGLGDGKWWPAVIVGVATHMSPRTAVLKAILELGHTGPSVRRLMSDGECLIPREPEEVCSITDHALYYARADRARAVDFLRTSGDTPLVLSELAEPDDLSLIACVERMSAAGVRVAIADVTSPDVANSPFRVVRALGTHMQPIDFGFNLRRLANPRLKAMLVKGLNPHPHPMA